MSLIKHKKETLVANANITKIGITDAVAKEEAAKPSKDAAVEAAAPNISERRVVGKKEIVGPGNQKIVIENL